MVIYIIIWFSDFHTGESKERLLKDPPSSFIPKPQDHEKQNGSSFLGDREIVDVSYEPFVCGHRIHSHAISGLRKKLFLFIIPTWVFYGKIYTNRKIHKNFIRHPIGLFFIISHMSLWMKKFQYVFQQNTLVNIIERTLYGGLKIWILLSCVKNNIWLTRCMCSFVKYCFATQK